MIKEYIRMLDKLFDKIADANISEKARTSLLIIVTLAYLVHSFWFLLIIKELTDIADAILLNP